MGRRGRAAPDLAEYAEAGGRLRHGLNEARQEKLSPRFLTSTPYTALVLGMSVFFLSFFHWHGEPTCPPDRPSKILLVQVWTLSSSPISLVWVVCFLSFFESLPRTTPGTGLAHDKEFSICLSPKTKLATDWRARALTRVHKKNFTTSSLCARHWGLGTGLARTGTNIVSRIFHGQKGEELRSQGKPRGKGLLNKLLL